MEEMHQHKVAQMIKSAEGSAGLLHKISKPTAWRRGTQILVKEEECARLLDRCEAKRKEWAKHWLCDEEVQNVEEKPWKNEWRNARGSTAKANRVPLGKSVEIVQSKHRSWVRRLSRQDPSRFNNRNERKIVEFWEKGGAEWKMAATSMHDDVLRDSEEFYEF